MAPSKTAPSTIPTGGSKAAGVCRERDKAARASRTSLDQPFVSGILETAAGNIPQVSSGLTRTDRWGSIKARWAIGRMRFTIDPGLYALGSPDADSPVLATANYKMSFDRLRESLAGRSAWILVLDTDGINVWCAAGKGTFGTDELVHRIQSSRMEKVVSHRVVILPQLGGPGIAAHEVKKSVGFKVIYGPIRSDDLAAFLDNGMKASPPMRRKTFAMRERFALIPVEMVGALKWVVLLSPVFFVLGGLVGPLDFRTGAWGHGLPLVLILFGALIAGAILTPLFLPWLPGRAFSVKGFTMGVILSGALAALWTAGGVSRPGALEILSWVVLGSALSAYLAMNFTGASTYTSLSGVRKEMKWAVPIEIGGAFVGICLWVVSRLSV
ncbi:MAG: acetyl-CoA synthase subunit gamma [Deltaproteobacteria bacterium]|nr:acetyl-CoA synthase subunit gamma [Deltaproteobacteria bacterium]MBW2285710.1 acetyl-CoA synthase subunit gamma [Deltaproteobacteria bacterium]